MARANTPIAFIPGVSHDAVGGTSHSFVQVVRPGGQTTYLEYPVEAFTLQPATASRSPSAPTASPRRAWCSTSTRDGVEVRGEISFGPLRPWPVTLHQPGIMGWYRFVPRMECYHGIVSLDHEVSGTLDHRRRTRRFRRRPRLRREGLGPLVPAVRGCGRSPTTSTAAGTSVQISVARIPWMGSAFVGFIAGVLIGERAVPVRDVHGGSADGVLELARGRDR